MFIRLRAIHFISIALILAATGCSTAERKEGLPGPRDRLGALPFPGAFTLYHASDPDFLGKHCYERSAMLAADEADGIVYTRRAGFIDLAHVRITIDTVRYCTEEIRAAQARGHSSVTLLTLEGSAFRVNWQD